MPERRGLLLARLVATLAIAFSGRPVVAVDSCSTGDLDLDGFVGVTDMLTMLGQWGDCVDPASCPADVDGDGVVGIQDFLDLLAAWGPTDVLGTHIEMFDTPGVDFPVGSTHHPDEHPLQLDRGHLLELLDGLIGMLADPHLEVHDEFIIFPF